MSLTIADGAHYEQNQKKVYYFSTTGTIPDDADVAIVTAAAVALTLPANPRPGQVVHIGGKGHAVTVLANTGQTLTGSGADLVDANFSRDYLAATTTYWLAQHG